jgi:hypothetical protein
MALSRCCSPLRTVLRIAGDFLRLVAAATRSHTQLAAENLFLKKQLALPVLSGHRIREGQRVVVTPILSGLHNEYRLEPRAA